MELPKSTIVSPLQDDVSSGEFKRNLWYIEEDELLLRAWLDISKGVVDRGNDPKMVSVKRITKYYEDNCRGGVVGTWNQLKSRWTKIKIGFKKFVECSDQASLDCKGDMDETEIVTRAHRLYRSQNDDR